jgi:hypothetical protein
MAHNIHEFVGQFKHGGARAGQFKIEVANPINAEADPAITFQAKATAAPSIALGDIEFPYFGRKIHFAGVHTFEPWTVTIVEDEDFLVRDSLETWTNYINGFQSNVRKFGTANPAEYKTTAKITQFSKDGSVLRLYQMFGVWPQALAALDYNWENDTMVEYEATFRFDYFEVTEGITGNAGGN